MLGRMQQAQRDSMLHILAAARDSWCEEFAHKLGYWRQLPWLLLGMWPQDSETGRIASEACEQWEEVVRAGNVLSAHRVSYRMMHPGAHSGMALMIRAAARSGEAHPELLAEIKEMNFTPTCEQAAEGIHASVFLSNAFHGRNRLPPAIAAHLALPRNLASLHHWPRLVAASAYWHKYLARALLIACNIDMEFIRHAEARAIVQTLYHCHPLQLFKEMKASADTLTVWNALGKNQPLAVHAAEKLILDFFAIDSPPVWSSRCQRRF